MKNRDWIISIFVGIILSLMVLSFVLTRLAAGG
jgi:hypothetical protein